MVPELPYGIRLCLVGAKNSHPVKAYTTMALQTSYNALKQTHFHNVQLLRTNQKLLDKIANLKSNEEKLRWRESVLQAINVVATRLLFSDKWHEVFQEALVHLGQSAGAKRIMAFRCEKGADTKQDFRQIFKWEDYGNHTCISTENIRQDSILNKHIDFFQGKLRSGRHFSASIEMYPKELQHFLGENNIQFISFLPILTKGNIWGIIELDFCHDREKLLTPNLDIFQTAADIIGTAIYHRHLEKIIFKSRERYRTVVDQQIDMIYRFKPDWTITFVNDAYCSSMGEAPSCLLGKDLRLILSEEELKAIQKIILSLSRDKPVNEAEYPVKSLSGEILRWYMLIGRAIFDHQGCILEYQIVDRDITNHKHVEEMLQLAHDELEKKFKERSAQLSLIHHQLLHAEKLSAVGKLSASIAHEFGNPIFSIRNLLEGIKEKTHLDRSDNELIGLALEECNRVKDLLLNLQSFNRPTNEVCSSIDVHQTIDNVLALSAIKYKKKNVTLQKDYGVDVPEILAVGDQLKQVFLNLFNNAYEAIPKVGGTLSVKTRHIKDQVLIEIADTGAGIRQEDIAHIFEPFFSTKAEVEGTGLGLSVSYGIVKSHHGDIKCKSVVGRGTSFTITLPIKG